MRSIFQIINKPLNSRKTKWVVIALYIIAMLVLLLKKKIGLQGDEGAYSQSAIDILEGRGFSWLGFKSIVPPLYPYFLAGLFFLGFTIKMVYFVQVLMMAWIMLAMNNIIVNKFQNIRMGIIAMLLFAVHPMISQSALFIATQTLFVFILMILVWFIVKYENSNNKFFFLLIGFLLGVAAITRYASYLLIVPIIIYYFFKWRSFSLKNFFLVFLIVVGYITVLSPWSVRNTAVYNKFIVLTASNGFGVWTATCEKDDWSCWLPKRVGENKPTQSIYKTLIQQKVLTENMSDIEKGEIAQKEGIKELKKNPSNYFRTITMNFLRLYTNFPYPQKPSMATIVYGLFNLFILFMAVLGFFSNKKGTFLFAIIALYFTGLHTFVHIASPWYHIQTIPFLCILACVGINYLLMKFNVFSKK